MVEPVDPFNYLTGKFSSLVMAPRRHCGAHHQRAWFKRWLVLAVTNRDMPALVYAAETVRPHLRDAVPRRPSW
jgi:hypothetical protein